MYNYTKKVKLSFNNAIKKVKKILKEQGFGVLAEINVKETLKNKINVDFENYMILGACNPPFAYQALLSEIEIGLLLPCNIIVYSKNNETFISSILPTKLMSMSNHPKIKDIAKDVENKLKLAINSV